MGRPLGGLLLLLGLHGTCGGFQHGNCTDYRLQFERVFSVPGASAMLRSSLVSVDVFDFASVPFSVSWFDPSGRELSDPSGRVLSDPSGRELSDPSGRELSDPSGRVLSDPSGRVLSDPSGRELSDPSGRVLSDPSGRELSDPSGRVLSDPSGRELSDPSGRVLSDPSGRELSDPSGRELSDRSGRVLSDPSGRVLSDPSGRELSDPSGRELSDRSGRVLLAGDTLWVLDLQLEDSGDYVTVLRTPSRCYRQATRLLVEPPPAAACGRPRKSLQTLTSTVTDVLNCPLTDYVGQLDRYNVTSHLTWYRGCERIVDGTGRYTYMGKTKLKIDGVEPNNNSSYTCTLNFTLGGMNGTVSETIEAWVSEKYSLTPQIREPANQRLTAPMGSSFSQRCRVFVPCVGKPRVDVVWMDTHSAFILDTKPGHIYTSQQSSWRQDLPRGVWLERVLMFSQLTEEDFYVNYTCLAQSSRGTVRGYFSLLPADPNILLPVGSALGGVAALFMVSVVLYSLWKVDMVLWFRGAFPVLYPNTDLDGKWYDAYVAYPQAFSQEVEAFALHALPQVLEEACGYKLFIAGRDCVSGTAIVDSVEENIQASRRLLLLYTASTFTNRRHTSNNNNNNNISKSSDDDVVYLDSRQQLECVTAMNRALLEGSLKVILVELEKISPAQLALFPESVRHLRKKQGAVCWWKNPSERRRWRMCTACTREDHERGRRDALCPSSGFWKELRYRMPVRVKRAKYPEKTALLNL